MSWCKGQGGKLGLGACGVFLMLCASTSAAGGHKLGAPLETPGLGSRVIGKRLGTLLRPEPQGQELADLRVAPRKKAPAAAVRVTAVRAEERARKTRRVVSAQQ